jgi:putative membrane protein
MTCIIPKDFTQTIASADSSDPENSELTVRYNEASNLLASQVGGTVWKQVRTSVSDTVAKEYWNTVFSKVNNGADQIHTAANGAYTLRDGLVGAHTGSSTITDNLLTLTNGSSELTDGLKTLANGTATLKSGTSSLVSGSQQLASGSTQLSSGTQQLQDSTAALPDQSQVDQAQSGSDQISDGIGQLQDGTDSLSSGAQKMQNGASRLQAGTDSVIAGVGSADDTSSTTVFGGINQLIAGMGSTSNPLSIIGGLNSIAQGIGSSSDATTDTLYGATNVCLAGIGTSADTSNTTLYGATNQMSSALSNERTALDAAQAAMTKLESGQQLTADEITAIATAYGTADATNKGLTQGVTGEQAGLSSLSEGVKKMQTDGLEPLSEGAKAAQAGANEELTGLNNLKTGVETVSGGLDQISDGIGTSSDQTDTTIYGGANLIAQGVGTSADGTNSTIFGGLNNLDDGFSQFSTELMPLVQKSPELRSAIVQLNSGATQLNDGISAAVSGTAKLDSGASDLNSGAQSAESGSAKITDGSSQLHDGSQTLTNGLTDAVNGSSTLGSSLDSGANDTVVQEPEAKAEVMKDPVKLNDEYFTTVKNYGTGFAPYFISLGLWVGALMTSFAFKPLNNRLIMSGGNPFMIAFSNFIPLAVISVIQAVLLLVVLQFGLQLQIDNPGLYYAFGIMTALVFAAIMQILMAALGFPGKFVAIIVLMLQLTSSAGTFPIEQTPAFFQVVSPFMPMTYVVQGMRQVMTGVNMNLAGFDAAILIAIGVVCFLLTVFCAWHKRVVRMDVLHPLIKLG